MNQNARWNSENLEVKICYAILKTQKGGFKQNLEILPQHMHITLTDVTNKYTGKEYRVNFTNNHTHGKENTVNGTIHVNVLYQGWGRKQ
jgi:hypothetical protein